MEKKADEYCEKILIVLMMSNEKIRFNELYRTLNKFGVKMSKPTLIEHLNHLVAQELVQREEEDKQKVTYVTNWSRFKQVKKAKELNQLTLQQIKIEKTFKERGLEAQTAFTTAMLTIGELFYLKLQILDILEPENKLHNYFSYTFIRRLFNLYAAWLIDSCKESKENSQKVLKSLNKMIKGLQGSFFDVDQEAKSHGPKNAKNSLLDL
jgi:DNA-binding HxlR family transcriptional regulator